MRFGRRENDTKTPMKTKKQQSTTGRLEMKAVAGAVATHQWRRTACWQSARRGDKEDNDEMAMTTNGATGMPQ